MLEIFYDTLKCYRVLEGGGSGDGRKDPICVYSLRHDNGNEVFSLASLSFFPREAKLYPNMSLCKRCGGGE